MPTVREEWGLECPKCKDDSQLTVQVTTYADLTVDGTDVDCESHEWDENSNAECKNCGWLGTVKQATVDG